MMNCWKIENYLGDELLSQWVRSWISLPLIMKYTIYIIKWITFQDIWGNCCSFRSGIDDEEMDTLDLVSESEESVFSKPNIAGNFITPLIKRGLSSLHVQVFKALLSWKLKCHPSVCPFSHFPPEPLGQFQPNFAQNIFR